MPPSAYVAKTHGGRGVQGPSGGWSAAHAPMPSVNATGTGGRPGRGRMSYVSPELARIRAERGQVVVVDQPQPVGRHQPVEPSRGRPRDDTGSPTARCAPARRPSATRRGSRGASPPATLPRSPGRLRSPRSATRAPPIAPRSRAASVGTGWRHRRRRRRRARPAPATRTAPDGPVRPPRWPGARARSDDRSSPRRTGSTRPPRRSAGRELARARATAGSSSVEPPAVGRAPGVGSSSSSHGSVARMFATARASSPATARPPASPSSASSNARRRAR